MLSGIKDHRNLEDDVDKKNGHDSNQRQDDKD